MFHRLPLVIALACGLAACSPRSTPDAASAAPAESGRSANAASASTPPASRDSLTSAAAPDFSTLMERVGPAVVNVTTSATRHNLPTAGQPAERDPLSEFFRRFMQPDAPSGPGGQPREFRSRGIGSGFVIDADGHVLTNAHVVADADEVTVRFAGSKEEHQAKVVGSDRQTDVALPKVASRNLPVAAIGDSRRLKAGEWVAAIGSPFGFANTITAGIVSATERSLPTRPTCRSSRPTSRSTPATPAGRC